MHRLGEIVAASGVKVPCLPLRLLEHGVEVDAERLLRLRFEVQEVILGPSCDTLMLRDSPLVFNQTWIRYEVLLRHDARALRLFERLGLSNLFLFFPALHDEGASLLGQGRRL